MKNQSVRDAIVPDFKVNDKEIANWHHKNSSLAIDKNGTVIIAWADSRSGNHVYAQRKPGPNFRKGSHCPKTTPIPSIPQRKLRFACPELSGSLVKSSMPLASDLQPLSMRSSRQADTRYGSMLRIFQAVSTSTECRREVSSQVRRMLLLR
jgi:hypothetical protein